MKLSNDLNKIPKTGRIGRFAKILASKIDTDIFIRIMQDSSEYGKYKPDKKAVEVELKQSIITGGDYCEFEIKCFGIAYFSHT